MSKEYALLLTLATIVIYLIGWIPIENCIYTWLKQRGRSLPADPVDWWVRSIGVCVLWTTIAFIWAACIFGD